MGYFANGTEAEIFQDEFCEGCAHWKLDEESDSHGCPVFDAHFLFQRDQLNSEGKKEGPVAGILSLLIAEKDGLRNECQMFHPVNMVPTRRYEPPTPEAYRMLANAAYEMERFVEVSAEISEAQCEAAGRCYMECGTDGKPCNGRCAASNIELFMANCMAGTEAGMIRRYLATHAVPRDNP